MDHVAQRTKLLDQMETIVVRAESENRNLDTTETEQFTALQGRIETLDALQESRRPQGTLRAIGGGAPAIHDRNAEHNSYSLLKAVQYMLRPHVVANAGLEVEVARELEKRCPSIEAKGILVPTNLGAVTKAVPGIGASPPSGIVAPDNPNQLDPLTAIGHLDNLFTQSDTAILPVDPLANLGMKVITGLTEREHDIPVQSAGLIASHALIDTALPASSDPAFTNRPMTPHLCGSICTLLLSSIFARHSVVGEDWFGNALRDAVFKELTRVRLLGDAVAQPKEPDGLVKASTANRPTQRPR